ncbi:MAG: imidazolonepropionase [Candidatus Aminicenantes bacterium]|nr:imidazolonepropionase [Candidatus Aminicenantes bacterium]
MSRADLVLAGCRQLLTCRGGAPKRGSALADVGLVENGWLAALRGRVVYAGDERGFKEEVRLEPEAETVDCRDFVVLPGFVDCHTHLPFAGSRAEEFLLRLQGWTYQQLAAKGLGILTTVAATRAAREEDLVRLCLERLDLMLCNGATTVEAKSGYGLSFEDEIKQLQALKKAAVLHPVDIVPTFMGAHEIPPEYRGRREEYIALLLDTILPEVRSRGLAEFFDVFCETGVFSAEETRRMARAARAAGLQVKVHADEFTDLGGAALAAEEGARSAEHLLAVSEEGIRKLAASGTAAVLLPGVPFFLRLERRAPARALIEAGAVVALGSDFNPGSSMVASMHLVLQLGVFTLGLNVEEAIVAATANAAYAAGREDRSGRLEPGLQADALLCDIPHYAHLAYELGRNPIRHAFKNGRFVVRDGRRT